MVCYSSHISYCILVIAAGPGKSPRLISVRIDVHDHRPPHARMPFAIRRHERAWKRARHASVSSLNETGGRMTRGTGSGMPPRRGILVMAKQVMAY